MLIGCRQLLKTTVHDLRARSSALISVQQSAELLRFCLSDLWELPSEEALVSRPMQQESYAQPASILPTTSTQSEETPRQTRLGPSVTDTPGARTRFQTFIESRSGMMHGLIPSSLQGPVAEIVHRGILASGIQVWLGTLFASMPAIYSSHLALSCLLACHGQATQAPCKHGQIVHREGCTSCSDAATKEILPVSRCIGKSLSLAAHCRQGRVQADHLNWG